MRLFSLSLLCVPPGVFIRDKSSNLMHSKSVISTFINFLSLSIYTINDLSIITIKSNNYDWIIRLIIMGRTKLLSSTMLIIFLVQNSDTMC